MCEICHKCPCDPRCPNAPEEKGVYTCAYCDDPIVDGEDCFCIDGEYYHEDCFGDCAATILLEKFGAVRMIAEAEEPDYEYDYDD